MAAVCELQRDVLMGRFMCKTRHSHPSFKRRGILCLILFIAAISQVHSSEVLWLDNDMKNIPEPKERESGYYDYLFKGQLVEGAKQQLDVPRWIRRAIGQPKEAANV